MARKRKTAAQRRHEQYEAKQRAWDQFLPQLESVTTHAEALILLGKAGSQSSPGRSFYSNLGFFLQTFGPPAGANEIELSEYLRLIRLFDDAGVMKDGYREQLEAAMGAAIKQKVGGFPAG